MATKKKTTMTLKDFHGGSIPSDLPLPSAPGISIRPPDRPSARPRPSAAPGGTGVGVPAPPFLPNPSTIGRHFDEDERKPFDASSNPRRAPDPDPVRSNPLPGASVKRNVNYATPVSPGGFPNAWGVRKESGGENLPVQPWSATRIAQTSAVEKVLSGMWQSKPPNVEVIRFQDGEGLEQSYAMERPRSGSDVGNWERKDGDLRDGYLDRDREQERGRSVIYHEGKERSVVGHGSGSYNIGVRPVSAEGRFVAAKVQQQPGASDVQERPKLKLFPRTKQLEASDSYAQVFEEKQMYQRSVSALEVSTVKEMHGGGNASQVIEDEGSRAVERPKLNLKPRTQPVEQPNVVSVKERKMVFGGARPRELVLKERGVDVPNEPDLIVQPSRNDLPKTELQTSNQSGEKNSFSVGQKTGRDDKRGHRPDVIDKIDATRSSWRNDNRKNARENDKPTEQQRADVVDNWRKPVEPPKPEPSGLRFGKAASPLELAQAFSRSGSELESESRGANNKNLPGRSQVPFTRLTDKRDFYPRSAQKQINGY